MPVQKLKAFLDENGIKYVTIQHSAAYSAQEVAAHTHIPGKELAKTVMVRIDGKMTMAVVPASQRVDLDRLRDVAGQNTLSSRAKESSRDTSPRVILARCRRSGTSTRWTSTSPTRLQKTSRLRFPQARIRNSSVYPMPTTNVL